MIRSQALWRSIRNLLIGLSLGTISALNWAGLSDLATAPLETSTSSLVKPNIFFILDDSGSMDSDYLPDWANSTKAELLYNSSYNGIYYNPAITYLPPLKYDGSSYLSWNATNSVNWTKVPNDGYGIQLAGTTTVNTGYYYTFSPGEYCTQPNLRTCNEQSIGNTSYPYPATLRWCTTSALTTCQANRIDSGTTQYKSARYPGVLKSKATITVAGTGSTVVSSVKIGGLEILSGATSASSTVNTVADNILLAINDCTGGITGNCQIAGYSATRSNGKVTITAPHGNNGATPVVTRTGTMSVTPTAFTGGVPGQTYMVNIDSSVNSYPYPGTSAKASTRTDCAGTTCTYAEEITNYANWYAYYRTRMQTMKTAASQALINLGTGFRLGYMSINGNATNQFLDIANITTGAGGQKDKFYAKLFAATPNNSTPLRSALSKAGQYFAGKWSGSTIDGVAATDPVQYACQRNYTILSTDGYWNETTTPKQIDKSTDIGNQDGSDPLPYKDGNTDSLTNGNTLADVAAYYYKTDIRDAAFSNATNAQTGSNVASNTGTTGQQRMYTYTLGLGVSGFMQYDRNYLTATSGDYYDVAQGRTASASVCPWQTAGETCTWPVPKNNTQTAVDDLWHAAVNGRGTYYSAGNPADLKQSLDSFVNEVSAATGNSASATTSTTTLSAAGSNYVFATRFCSGKWFGDLIRYSIDSVSAELNSTPDWSQSGAGTDCSTTNTTLLTTPLLDNRTWSNRNIFTYDPTNASPKVSFTWGTLNSTIQGYFKMAYIGGLSQLCSGGVTCLPASQQVDSTTAGPTSGIGGVNLVNYLRGDRSNEGTLNTNYYYQRKHVLGDIVNSRPVYVGKPTNTYLDASYTTFKNANASRAAMVYVGANDGMLHAFDASTGSEAWAYIPSMLLPNLYKLADKNYAGNHLNFVDGNLARGDVYFGGTWKTILVGGLGQGGKGYFALDVTNPSSPTILWEFTSDISAHSAYIKDADLGYTYGTPVITKLKDGTWAVMVTSGYNNIGSGKGIVWVLNAQTGAIIKKIDTGAGSATATVPGCTAIPCPAGLARITAWIDKASDNTATFLYGGDLFGNVWRMDLRNLTSTGGTVPIQLLAVLTDASGNRQPITAAPALGSPQGQRVVYVGTGSYLGLADVSNTQTQSIYAIRDPLTGSSATVPLYSSARSSLCASATSTGCFVKQTLTDSGTIRTATSALATMPALSNINGWFVDLPQSSERIYTDFVLVSGVLLAVSNIPNTTNACATGGSSYLNYLDYRTGLTLSYQSEAGSVLSSTALGSTPTVVVASDGSVKAIISLSDGTNIVKTIIPIGGVVPTTRRMAWRELVIGE